VLTIKLPGRIKQQSRVHAGITFVDGAATVPDLGPSRRAYFDRIGATITDSAEAIPTVSEISDIAAARGIDLTIGDKLLKDCTVAELRDLAGIEGIAIPSRANKPEILHAFLTAFMDRD
jgi:hypothetical protein